MISQRSLWFNRVIITLMLGYCIYRLWIDSYKDLIPLGFVFCIMPDLFRFHNQKIKYYCEFLMAGLGVILILAGLFFPELINTAVKQP